MSLPALQQPSDDSSFRLAFDGLPFGAFLQDPHGQILAANQVMLAAIGRAEDEVRGRSPDEIGIRPVREDGSPMPMEELPAFRALKTGLPVQGVVLGIRSPVDGETHWIRVSAIPQSRNPGEPPCQVLSTFHEITHERLVEDALRLSEEKFFKMFRFSPVPCVLARVADGRFADVNQSFLDLFGYTREQVVGRTSADIAMYADFTERARLIGMLLAQGRIEQQESTFRVNGGRKIQVLISSQLVQLNGVEHHITTVVDITARKQAERALRESEEKFAGAFQAGPVARAIVQTSSEQVVDANRSFLELLEYPQEAVIGRKLKDLDLYARPEDGVEIRLRLEQAGVLRDFETVLKTRTGRTVDALVSAQLFTLNGELHIITTLLDITRRKQAERALFESSERLRSLVESADSVVVEFDYDGRVMFANEIAGRLWGHTPAEMEGRLISELAPAGYDWQARLAQVREVINSGKGLAEERVATYADGRQRWFRASYQPVFGPEGRPVSAVLLSTDITETKAAQQQLEQHAVELTRANAELTRANQAKSDFLAMMSHELRTPLNAVLTLTESLREGTYGPVNEKQSERLATIQASGAHLLNIINDILDFSRLDAARLEPGRVTLLPERVDVDETCRAAMQLVRQQAASKNLSFSTAVRLQDGTMLVDPQRLRQVLVNLLGNAVKFTPAGGRVSLQVSELDGESVRFAVQDTGIGIAAADLGRVFEPFTQLDSALSRQYGGTGLGLALSARLVEVMGGSIGVESQPGQGSCFWFILPARRPRVSAQPGEPASGAGATKLADATKLAGAADVEVTTKPADEKPEGRLVLVVEDHADNLEALCDRLTARGCRVVTAANGNEALERAAQHHPDVILMDIQMPGMDGLEATRRLRAQPAFAHTRIIALTALVMPGDRERCLQAGADAYLEKPVHFPRLMETIEG